MNVADLDLCRELYELSGWVSPDLYYQYVGGKSSIELAAHGYEKEKWVTGVYDSDVILSLPAYDLGFLIRKLPALYFEEGEVYQLTLLKGSAVKYQAYSLRKKKLVDRFAQVGEEDELENLTAKLAIELFKAGILTRDSKE